MVSITGSVRAGRQVAAGAAPQLKRVHLELGGKAPVVVFADADLATAAADIAVAGVFNAVCMCMCTACALHAHCMCTACALHISTRWWPLILILTLTHPNPHPLPLPTDH